MLETEHKIDAYSQFDELNLLTFTRQFSAMGINRFRAAHSTAFRYQILSIPAIYGNNAMP